MTGAGTICDGTNTFTVTFSESGGDVPTMQVSSADLTGGATASVAVGQDGVHAAFGDFRLGFGGEWTGPIDALASADEIESALEALSGIEQVEVSAADAGLTVSEAAALTVTSSGTRRSWAITFGAAGETVPAEQGDRPLIQAAWTLEAYASIDGAAYPAEDLSATPPRFAWRGLESPAADPRPAVEVQEIVSGQQGNLLAGVAGTDDARAGDITLGLRRRSANGTFSEVYIAGDSVFELRCTAYNGSFTLGVDGAESGAAISSGASDSAQNPSFFGFPADRQALTEIMAANSSLPSLAAAVQRMYEGAASLAGFTEAQIAAVQVSVSSTDGLGADLFNVSATVGVPAISTCDAGRPVFVTVQGWPTDAASAAAAAAPYTGSRVAPSLRVVDESGLLALASSSVSPLDGGEGAGVHAEIREMARGSVDTQYAGDGVYTITYDAVVKGTYDAVIQLDGDDITADHPAESAGIVYEPTTAQAGSTVHDADGLAQVGVEETFTVQLADQFENELGGPLGAGERLVASFAGGADPRSRTSGSSGTVVVPLFARGGSANSDGVYAGGFTPATAGVFDLEIELEVRGGLLATYYAADDLSTYPISGLLPHCPSPIPAEGRALQFTVDACDSTRVDGAIDFNWGTQPALSLAFRGPSGDLFPTEEWSARWSGSIFGMPTANDGPSDQTAIYVLRSVSDGGVRVRVNGTVVINDWEAAPNTATSSAISLPLASDGAIGASIEVEYRHGSGAAAIALQWARSDAAGQTLGAFATVPSAAFAFRRAIRGSP